MNSFEQLFPRPKKSSATASRFPVPSSFPFHIEETSFSKLENHLLSKGFHRSEDKDSALLLIQKESFDHPEKYSIHINPDRIILSAGKEVGVFRGLQTIYQLFRITENHLQCGEIEDFPDLDRRGFMLDVSRCKVPTMESLYQLIDLLAAVHINELQLYIEHTFSFEDHQVIWNESSPFTAEEIQKIDQYCKERFIELVPNLNSFGHFERWLMHNEYRHLAECPEGFSRENPYIVRDHGTTLKPNQASLDFINSLYSEYLPNFSSDKFNVGMDEPWELGQGWSQKLVEKMGKDKVYLTHLDGIRKLVESHGKKMQFWADVLLENPENTKLLPNSASPIIWGYEPSHPFPEQAKAIAQCGLQFCLAPGTGSWRSFSGRLPNALENIKLAISNAKEYGAEGILLTSWGDCGNHQPWATLYPPLLYGAAKSWNCEGTRSKNLLKALNTQLFNGIQDAPSEGLLELGKLDQIIESNIPNTSLCWYLLFAPLPQKLLSFLKDKHTSDQLTKGISHLDSIKEKISQTYENPEAELIKKEILMGIDLSRISLQKGIHLLKNEVPPSILLPSEVLRNYENLWLKRAREGGLKESINLLKELNLSNQAKDNSTP